MKVLLLFLFTFLPFLHAQENPLNFFDAKGLSGGERGNLITDPAISRRCFTLVERRQEKLTIKQKIRALIKRNNWLQEVTPKNKKTVLIKLKQNMRHLKQEDGLIGIKISQLEETIIRSGCPGITLR